MKSDLRKESIKQVIILCAYWAVVIINLLSLLNVLKGEAQTAAFALLSLAWMFIWWVYGGDKENMIQYIRRMRANKGAEDEFN